MSAQIIAEVWDEKTGKYKAEAGFATFDGFHAHALDFKKTREAEILRVHIPGGFSLTRDDQEKLEALGIERI